MQSERTLISRVLQTGRIRAAMQAGVEPGHFHKSRQEWQYLVNFYMKHSEVPSVDVFCERFPDFKYQKSARKTIRVKPAVDSVIDNHVSIELGNALKAAVEALDEKPSAEVLEEHIQKLAAIQRVQSGDEDIDIIGNIDEHVAEFERMRNAQNDDEFGAFIPTPWPAVNDIWGGWRNGELDAILARMNEGKSWLAVQAGTWAALNGARPYIAPLEMSRYEVETRIMTIASFYLARKKGKKKRGKLILPEIVDHQTIRSMLEGKRIYRHTHLMLGHNAVDINEYRKFAAELKTYMPKGIILPDLKSRSSAFTMSTFIAKVERSEADIAFLDYLGLLQDVPRGQQRWEMWSQITKELKLAARFLDIPIVICVQAGRTGASQKTPELEDIADSDSIGRDCDRILSIRQKDTTMRITNIKNRQGEKNWAFPCHFYPDYGIIEQDMAAGIDRDIL